MLNDVFVSAVPALATYQFIRSGHVLFSTCMLQSASLRPLVLLLVFQIFVINTPSFPFAACLQEFRKYSLQMLIKALPPLLNGILQYQYITTALKIIICNNIVCFCLPSKTNTVKATVVSENRQHIKISIS